ncbi:MAG: GAF domain-containing protein, partial [Acidobacteriales bacterium]|nr:GAF domain-containing protein [Terriglobales bacterium]
MMLFGIYFPERLGVDRRWPWLKWLLLGPLLFRALQISVVSLLQLQHAALAVPIDRFLPVPTAFVLMQMAAIGIFFSATGYKGGTSSNRDARRRLLLLYAGATVSLTPIFILLIMSLVRGTPRFSGFPAWVTFLAFLLLAGFPLTMAYVIVVHRAMDVRVVIRQGVQYLLAKGTVRVLQVVLSAVILTAALTFATEPGVRRLDRIAIVALSILIVILIRRFAERLRGWVDRKFFREAYHAEQILADLADKVRTMVETAPLLETVAKRISESLHVPRVAVLLNGGGSFGLAYALGYPNPPDIAIPENSHTAHQLRKEHHARIYVDDRDSWIHEATDAEKAALEKLETQLLLPLSMNQKFLGILSLGPKQSEEPFSKADLRLLDSVATQTGLALENSRLTAEIAAEVAHRERFNRELEIAREVQE